MTEPHGVVTRLGAMTPSLNQHRRSSLHTARLPCLVLCFFVFICFFRLMSRLYSFYTRERFMAKHKPLLEMEAAEEKNRLTP
jgi:hypothetical protein